MTAYLMKDGVIQSVFDCYNDALEELHKIQPNSFDYAITFDGWDIATLDEPPREKLSMVENVVYVEKKKMSSDDE